MRTRMKTLNVTAMALSALVAGTIAAAAQAGADQQNRGNREDAGKPAVTTPAPDARRGDGPAIRGTQGRGGATDEQTNKGPLPPGGIDQQRGINEEAGKEPERIQPRQ